VAWADDFGSLVYVSPQLKAMTGFSPTDWLADPRSWVSRLHRDDRDRVLAEVPSGASLASPSSAVPHPGPRRRHSLVARRCRMMPDKHGRAGFVRGS
jgi:hypothetical protein